MATAETQIQACEPSFPNNSVVEPLGMGKESSSGPEQRKRCPHRRQPCAGVKARPAEMCVLTGDWPAKPGEKGSHSWQGEACWGEWGPTLDKKDIHAGCWAVQGNSICRMRRAPCWGSRLMWGVSPSEVGKVPHGRGDTGADRRRIKYRETDQTSILIITEATVKIEKGLYWIRIGDTSDSSCFYTHTNGAVSILLPSPLYLWV